MTPISRTLFSATLVAAPLLLSASEILRKYVALGAVETGDPFADARSKIMQIAAHSELWLLHSCLALLGILAWLGAVIATAAVISARRPLLGLVAGILGSASAIGYATHLGFYTIPLGISAGMADQQLDAAAAFEVAGEADPFLAAMVLFFILTMVSSHFVLGFGLWRAQVAPWWAAACLPLAAALSLEPGASPLWGLVPLLPLIPFLFVVVRGSEVLNPPDRLAVSTSATTWN
jgi:hypothetical protein